MDWPWDWWVFLLLGIGGGILFPALIYYCYVICGSSEDDDKPTPLESVISFPGGQGERQNPIFNRRFSNASMQSSEGSVQLEVAELPTMAPVSEDSSQTTQLTATTEEDQPKTPGANDAAATSSGSPTTEAAPVQEQTEEERKAARAAKLKALRAQRANKKDNEWALLEESLAIIDQMYSDVFQTAV
eukprot:m.42081 g.42081  ORF g.42081 m.42081 type:complete len:187 (+) comp12855_c0_seq1:190-750(+)